MIFLCAAGTMKPEDELKRTRYGQSAPYLELGEKKMCI